MNPLFSVCVYCGSRPGAKPEYTLAAQAVGTWIGAHGGQLVYGGGKGGLMGIVAQATLLAGGRVVGIIPQALVEMEAANHDCTELHIVGTMHERKRMMAERAFEELFEVWTWRQLGYHDKPIGVLNVESYYDPLLEFLKATVEQQFLGDWQMELIRTGTDVLPLLPELVQAAGLVPAARLEEI
jgi:uncharacterized protein (TIGR00730 family)